MHSIQFYNFNYNIGKRKYSLIYLEFIQFTSFSLANPSVPQKTVTQDCYI